MKIIDVNVSIGRQDMQGQMVSEQQIFQMLDQYQIAHVVAYHELAKVDHKEGNLRMIRIAKESRGRIGACVIIDPSLGADNLPGEGSLLERLKDGSIECIRIFPTNSRVAFHPLYWEEVLETANELSMPVIIDEHYAADRVHDLFYCLPDMAKQYENVKFVIIRYGLNGGRHIMPLLRKCSNVYFTVEQMLDYMQIEEIFEAVGCDHLLFGSEYPELLPEGPLGLVMYADISSEDKEKILSKNWEKIRYDYS